MDVKNFTESYCSWFLHRRKRTSLKVCNSANLLAFCHLEFKILSLSLLSCLKYIYIYIHTTAIPTSPLKFRYISNNKPSDIPPLLNSLSLSCAFAFLSRNIDPRFTCTRARFELTISFASFSTRKIMKERRLLKFSILRFFFFCWSQLRKLKKKTPVSDCIT